MNSDQDNEMANDETPGQLDLEPVKQEALPPPKETKHPHLILIKPNEREAELEPDHDPPGWPDF